MRKFQKDRHEFEHIVFVNMRISDLFTNDISRDADVPISEDCDEQAYRKFEFCLSM